MKKHHNVYLDIETYGGQQEPSLDDISAPSNYKDPEKILKYKKDKLQEAWAKQALNPLKGEIICLGIAIDDEEPVAITRNVNDRGEERIMVWLDAYLNELTYTKLIGYNVLGFDFPWLYLRAVKYNLPILKNYLPTKKSDTSYLDLMQQVSSTLYGKDSYMSMKDVCGFFGIDVKDNGLDGSMVHQAYLDGRIKEIAEYCKQDVEATRELYKRLNFE
jgi:predicted PolB exonuclease-like 3'-5' exonuclease